MKRHHCHTYLRALSENTLTCPKLAERDMDGGLSPTGVEGIGIASRGATLTFFFLGLFSAWREEVEGHGDKSRPPSLSCFISRHSDTSSAGVVVMMGGMKAGGDSLAGVVVMVGGTRAGLRLLAFRVPGPPAMFPTEGSSLRALGGDFTECRVTLSESPWDSESRLRLRGGRLKLWAFLMGQGLVARLNLLWSSVPTTSSFSLKTSSSSSEVPMIIFMDFELSSWAGGGV